MRAVAADVVLILGDVGQMREIAVGANDRERLVGAEAVERRLEFAPRANFVVAMEADRGPADLLDQLVHLFALLLAHGVAEDSAEQADVAAQRQVLVGLIRRRLRHALGQGVEGHRAYPSARALDECCTAGVFGARAKSLIRRAHARARAPAPSCGPISGGGNGARRCRLSRRAWAARDRQPLLGPQRGGEPGAERCLVLEFALVDDEGAPAHRGRRRAF